jgi:hypothetical protein
MFIGGLGMPKRRQLHGRVLTRLGEQGCGYIENGEGGFLVISGEGTFHADLTPAELIELGTELIMHGTEKLSKLAKQPGHPSKGSDRNGGTFKGPQS